ncbi:H3K9 methyltransferase [Aphelenchoides avenae]|nr:H3K9 methyltransferase [Aphelenchus avenae]
MADDAEYEVDSVNGWKIENGQHSYAIKWTGHGYDYMTWEPPQNLVNCHDLLHDFLATLHQYGPTHTQSGPGYWMELVLPPPVELFSFAAIPAPDVQEVIHIDDDSDEDSDGVPEPVEDLHNDADYMVEDSNAETDGE